MRIKGIKALLLTMTLVTLVPANAFAKEKSILSDSSKKAVAESSLSKLDEKELLLARYEIPARHGKTFYTEELQKYFEKQSWYTPFENYDSSCLTEIEKSNMETIYQYELAEKQKDAKKRFEKNRKESETSGCQVMSSSWVYIESPYYCEDLLGRWVDESNPTSPKIVDFEYKNGRLFYDYYSITPGNDNGLGLCTATSKFEYCSGTFSLNSETGFINCYFDDTLELYTTLEYDVMSDTLVKTVMDKNRLTLTKNNDFTFE